MLGFDTNPSLFFPGKFPSWPVGALLIARNGKGTIADLTLRNEQNDVT